MRIAAAQADQRIQRQPRPPSVRTCLRCGNACLTGGGPLLVELQLGDVSSREEALRQFGRSIGASGDGHAHIGDLLGAHILIPTRFDIGGNPEHSTGNLQLHTFELGVRQARAHRQHQQIDQRQTQAGHAVDSGPRVKRLAGQAQPWISDLHGVEHLRTGQPQSRVFLLQARAAQHRNANGGLGRHRRSEPFIDGLPFFWRLTDGGPFDLRPATRAQQIIDVLIASAR